MILKVPASRDSSSFSSSIYPTKQDKTRQDKTTQHNTTPLSSSFVAKIPPKYGSIAQAENLGGPITDSSQGLFTRGSGPGVVVGGDNNGTIVNGDGNTTLGPAYPPSNSVSSTKQISANIAVIFDGSGLRNTGLTVNYRSSNTTVSDGSTTTKSASQDVILGFTIGYQRTNKPTPERVEGANRTGKELIRTEEGGKTLNFVFDTPLGKGDSVVKVVVSGDKKTAAATIKRPDGHPDGPTYVETARIKQ
jgi:hypothetical protein